MSHSRAVETGSVQRTEASRVGDCRLLFIKILYGESSYNLELSPSQERENLSELDLHLYRSGSID